MPPYGTADVPHTAATDHRILRRPDRLPAKGPAQSPLLVSFFQPAAPDDAELSRDLGIGLVTLMIQGQLDPRLQNPHAVGLLEAALHRAPEDVEAWQARAQTLLLAKNWRGALAAFEAALRIAPQREVCLAAAAALAPSGCGPGSVSRLRNLRNNKSFKALWTHCPLVGYNGWPGGWHGQG
jgi:tetratricopeptide (TPR) repeat protein